MISALREAPELGWGTGDVALHVGGQVLEHSLHWRGAMLVALHNFSAEEQRISAKFFDSGHFDELLSDHPYASPEGGVDLAPYGYRWFRTEAEQL